MAKMFIGGELVDSVTKETYEIRNPANGAVVDAIPKGNEKDVQQAIQAAESAFKEWADVTPEDRGSALMNACELIKKNTSEIAQLLTQEQGKTLFEAGLEITIWCMVWSSMPGSPLRCVDRMCRCRKKALTAWLFVNLSVCAAVSFHGTSR